MATADWIASIHCRASQSRQTSDAIDYLRGVETNNSVVSELIAALEATEIETKTSSPSLHVLPTPYIFFQLGQVLYELDGDHQSLLQSYQSLLKELPGSYLCDVVFHDLNLAFQEATHSDDDLIRASHAICGLYTDTPVACQAGFSTVLCQSICTAYQQFQTKKDCKRECSSLLQTLSSLLLEGGVLDHREDDEEESQLRSIMELVQTLTDDAHNTCLGDMLEWQQQHIPTRTFLTLLKSTYDESPQREYLCLMLESSTKSSDFHASILKSKTATNNNVQSSRAKPVSAQSEIQRRIQLVKQVLPDLGEGYIEAALSCFQGNVERTVAALLEGGTSLPPVLQMMDPKLAARCAEATPDAYIQNDEEARQLTKIRLQEMERAQEQEAYALAIVGGGAGNDEYNDDYDDQYDGLDAGGELGGGDGESYDVDLDTIRTYNRAARQAESEDAFWTENRNTNRSKPEDGASKTTRQYRGPDKGRGGRVIGPDGRYLPLKKGGKKAAGSNNASSVETRTANDQTDREKLANDKASTNINKVQQRRKNENKAKVANHHRKDRAQKKASQGI